MKTRSLVFLLAMVGLSACDKIKDWRTAAAKLTASAVNKTLAAKGGGTGGPATPALQALVDQTEAGVIFRKDLPFPTKLAVTTTESYELLGRSYQESEIGKRAEAVNGTQLTMFKLERDGGRLVYQPQKSLFTAAEDEAAKKKPAQSTAGPALPPVVLRKVGKTWQADDRGDFRTAGLIKQLAPAFDQLLAENAVEPRPLWFAKHRFKIGDELEVTESLLPMLLSGRAEGSLQLKLESLQAVNGHPCGVWSVSGDIQRKQVPSFEGTFTDQDVTVQSGKLWLSLIYPVILKVEMDTIQSGKSGGQGNLQSRVQGKVRVTVTRDWQPAAP